MLGLDNSYFAKERGMKLQVSFDGTDLDKALEIAQQVEPHCTHIEVGSVLLYTHGIQAIKQFRKAFPQVQLVADAKIIDHAKEAVTVLAKAGADWITVMAGTAKETIHSACTTAHALDKKIMLDLLDAGSQGQSALEAKSLGADALIYHKTTGEHEGPIFIDRWNMVQENTTLPIFIAGKITSESIILFKEAQPHGIIVGSYITQAQNPLETLRDLEAQLSSL
jgi:3-keto-L-gulonate-6-phosphate decarboxylase